MPDKISCCSNTDRQMNYWTYWGFSEAPFQDVRDQRFFYPAQEHGEVLAELIDFITSRRGIAWVPGETGIGKTMLISALVQRLPQTIQPILLDRPLDEPMALTMGITSALGINTDEGRLLDLNRLTDALNAAARQGKFFVVLLDNAHLLTDRHLKEVCFLSQMEFPSPGQHLLPIVLVGHKGLDEKLGDHANPCLSQFIDVRLNLPGLSPAETILYIDHHLKQAGLSFSACFSGDCSTQFFAMTGGIPRLINQMCLQALERCWQENLSRVTPEILEEKGQVPPKDHGPTTKTSLLRKFGAMTGIMLAGVVLGVGLTAYTRYTSLAGKMSLRSNAISETFTSPRLNSSREQAPTAPTSPVPLTAPELADIKPVRYAVSAQLESVVASEPQVHKEVSGAETLPSPQATIRPGKMAWSTSTNYRVTAGDKNLFGIVAKHYPFNKKFAFPAIILANPEITDENLIFPGKNLYLPKMNKIGVITLGDNRYYLLYKRYEDISKVNKAVSNLKEHKIRFLVRETRHPDVGEVYRIFIGGYESEDDLKSAAKMAERK
jgi:type II secretory pathway predicted ATPase ExeA